MNRNTEVVVSLKELFLDKSCIISFELNYNTEEGTSVGVSICAPADGKDLNVLICLAEENLAMKSVNLHVV